MKKGFATFLVVVPVIALVLAMNAFYDNMEEERLQAQLPALTHLRQAEIDNSIKKSLMEILKFASEQKLPCDEKITLAASKISGVNIAPIDTWQESITSFYAKQDIQVEFYLYSSKVGQTRKLMPLTQAISIPHDPSKSIGGASAVLTCNPINGVVTNDLNLDLRRFLPFSLDGILYTVKDTNTNAEWEEIIPPGLYVKEEALFS